MTENEIQLEALNKVNDAIKEAKNDDTPHILTDGETLGIAGDPNKIKQLTNKKYKIKFRLPKHIYEDFTSKETEYDFTDIDIEYAMLPVNGMNASAIITVAAKIQSFFYEETEDDIKPKETINAHDVFYMMPSLSNEIYTFLTSCFNIDPRIKDYIKPVAGIETTYDILNDNPDILNIAKGFIG